MTRLDDVAQLAPGAGREVLRNCARRLAATVSVVTTCDGRGRPYGLTMSAVTCLSFDPALFLICVGETSETLPLLLRRRAFAINVLRRHQQTVAGLFAGKGGSEKFSEVAYRWSDSGLPLLVDALTVVQCEVIADHPGGDHRVVIGAVRIVQAGSGEPLLYYAGEYGGVERLGPATRVSPRESASCAVAPLQT